MARDYPTITAALAVAVMGDVVLVDPGTYPEDALAPATGVEIRSVGGRVATVVEAQSAGAHIFVMASQCRISGFTLKGATAGGAGLHFPGGVVQSRGENIDFNGCDIAIWSEAAGKSNRCSRCFYVEGTGTSFSHTEVGAHMVLEDCAIMTAAVLTNGVVSDGALSVAHVFGGHFDGDNTTNGIVALNGGFIRAQAAHLHSFTNSLYVGVGGGTLKALGVDITTSATWDVLVDTVAGLVVVGSTELDRTMVSVPTSTCIRGSAIDGFAGDEGTQNYGKFAVGTHNGRAEAVFGGGNSTAQGMAVLRNTNAEAGTWSDITTEMVSASGSSVAAFSALTVGASIFFIARTDQGDVSWSDLMPNVKVVLDSQAIVLGSGTLVAAVWTDAAGGSWETINVMVSDAVSPHKAYAEALFERANQADQIRLAFDRLVGNPVAKSYNGITGFAFNVSIATASITTSPILEQVKLGPDRTEHNANVPGEFFGSHEPFRVFLQGTGEDLNAPNGGVNAPGNYDISISSNVSYRAKTALFASGNNESAGAMAALPDGLDTSRKVVGTIIIEALTTNTGDIDMVAYLAQVLPGDVLDGSIVEASVPVSVSPDGTAQKTYKVDFEMDASRLAPGAFGGFTFKRLGSTDAYTGNVGLSSWSWAGHFWK